jgi:ribosomal protein S18 acetylase RimI-like enzyme
MDTIIIRSLTHENLPFAASQTKREDWDTSTQLELKTLFEYDPSGCFISELNKKPVGMCFGTAYEKFGYIGELIVEESARGRGIGSKLMQRAIDNLRSRGLQNIYLDAVQKAVPLYERLGFQSVCLSLRMNAEINGKRHEGVRPMKKMDLPAVESLDNEVFGDDRSYFIRHRLKKYPQLCYVQYEGSEINGFILGRQGRKHISVGPWVIDQSNQFPQYLIEHLALKTSNKKINIGILENNNVALAELEKLGFHNSPDHSVRMVLGNIPFPGKINQSYAIGAPSKG